MKQRGQNLLCTDLVGQAVSVNLDKFCDIYIVGAGKAAAGMSAAVCEILKHRISGGTIIVPYSSRYSGSPISIREASHPIPDKAAVRGTEEIINILKRTTESDLVIALVSGGGSALMTLPRKGISLSEKQSVTKQLLSSGASIKEMNVVRKHLSQVKGGQLISSLKSGITVISLIISDVVGDRLDIVASGPTVPDASTFKDARMILKKYDIWKGSTDRLSSSVKKIITNGIKGIIKDTPKPRDPSFGNVHNILIGNNALVCSYAARYFETKRLRVKSLGSHFQGEARGFGIYVAKLASSFAGPRKPSVFLLGGETTVRLNKTGQNGRGGRNQEAALVAAINSHFGKNSDITICCIGTDGIDGNSRAAGAVVTPRTISLIAEKRIQLKSYLEKHDSYNAFKKLHSNIMTGRTGTNLNDITIVCNMTQK